MKSQAKYPRNFREFPGPFRDFAKSLITQIHCNIHTIKVVISQTENYEEFW